VSWLSECRALDRRVWLLAVARLVVTAGYSMVMPFLAMHLAVDHQVPVVIVGGIWLVAGGLGALAQWLVGELADRMGRRSLMLGAMLARAGNLAAMGSAIAVDAPWPVIAGLTVLNSILRGFFEPLATALVADLVPPARRVAGYSLQRVGVNIGWAAGVAVPWMAVGVGYAALFYASAPLTLLAAASLWRLREPVRELNRRDFTLAQLLGFTRDRVLLRLLLCTLAFFMLQVQMFQTLSIYSAKVLHLSRAEVGTLYTLNGILVVLLQLPAVHVIMRLGTRRALMVGAVGYAVSFSAVGLATGHGMLLVCIAGVTMAEIISSPAQQTTITSLAPADRIGAYTGLFGLCQVVGQSCGPLIGAALLDVLPSRSAWFVLALLGLGAAVGYRRLPAAGRTDKPLLPAAQA
jgi:predicted MFS family arabinose efflux permease